MFTIKNKHLRKQAIGPTITMLVFGAVVAAVIIMGFVVGTEKKEMSSWLIAAFFSIFFLSGYKRYRILKKYDDLMARKTLPHYMKINAIKDINNINCSNCGAGKIANRNHSSKAFREFYCGVCGETLYYAERKDFI